MTEPAQIWNLPHEHIGRRVLVFDSLTSTNDLAAVNGSTLEPGTVILAREQTAGRGNYGRSWLSPTGAGVWMSIVLTPPPELVRPIVAIAWVAVSVAEVIRRHVNTQPALKWPNDVLLKGRKVAGILIEQRQAMIVGIGLNVNQSATQLLVGGLSSATSMAAVAGRSFDVDTIARELITELNREYSLLLHGEVATLELCWKWRMGLLGRQIIVERHDDSQITGRLLEMRFAGLTLQNETGVEQVVPEMVKHVFEANPNADHID